MKAKVECYVTCTAGIQLLLKTGGEGDSSSPPSPATFQGGMWRNLKKRNSKIQFCSYGSWLPTVQGEPIFLRHLLRGVGRKVLKRDRGDIYEGRVVFFKPSKTRTLPVQKKGLGTGN
eukprot:TRINITY_DN15048_c0_g1_i1.p2 TRINITY_DN15048_c0_g1~~TRINITY_DN15048_c0_g1_i1.p2  ORF type:complete len:117 (-),score=0.48 TRINITY_DN15048_c0_g1_i1:388-738(-)